MTVTAQGLIVMVVIATVCGSIGKALAGGGQGGLVASIALGFIGAILGSWIARALKLPELVAFGTGGERFPIVWSILGAALFVAVLGLAHRRRVVTR